MDLEDLGWNSFFDAQWFDFRDSGLIPARVVAQHRGAYRIRSQPREYLAELAGKLRHEADGCDELPAVGDWVGATPGHHGGARIEYVLPRKTKLSRKTPGRKTGEQLVAANVDTVFVVTTPNRDFNLRRVERYLSLVWDGGAQPVLLLNKTDLSADVSAYQQSLESVAWGVPLYLISALEGSGLQSLGDSLLPRKTAVFVGSSGVGKSTIINRLTGQSLPTHAVRESDDRGRHTTTSRQMIFLPGGGIVIDTPGMRGLQIWDSEDGLNTAFDDIATLAPDCRFRDCGHHGEPGCAVETAVQHGLLSRERLENFHKLQAELRFERRKIDPRAAQQEKQRWKSIHKAMRDRRGMV